MRGTGRSSRDSAPALAGLEGSCAPGAGPSGDWIRRAPDCPGFERYEARFAGHAFAPHRHDTYAIGITVEGVQAFGYRGAATVSLAGQVMILHPDERHDGRAGTETGFRYRILYLEPRLVGAALDGDGMPGGAGRPLPFVADCVTADPRLRAALASVLAGLEAPLDELAVDAAVQEIAEALAALDGGRRPRGGVRRRLDAPALERARALLAEAPERAVGSAELEAATGLDRYELARQFRARYGTSPQRYRNQRRLDRVRALIAGGMSLTEAALAAGFADQSHMTRQFKQAYGLPPGRWAAMVR